MTKKSGRDLAWSALNKIENEQAYANLALQSVFAACGGAVDQRDKAFGAELVYGTLRHLLKLDYLLGRLLSRPLNSLPSAVCNLLRLAFYQLIYLPDIPERAVCHSAVELVKRSPFKGLAALVNGVLRNYLRNGVAIVWPDRNQDLLEFLTVEYSHPRWLVERWLSRFGATRTETILKINNERPPLTVRVNRLVADPQVVLAELHSAGVECAAGVFLPEALHLLDLPVALEEMPTFQMGQITPQDESAMLVAHLVNPQPGETVVDLCAAPGGKSAHLAELMEDQGRIESLDNHPHKVRLIRETARRLRLTAINPILGDARQFSLADGAKADAVLVDAPCSGTGVLRRRVDARYRKTVAQIGQLVTVQQEILNQAAVLVRPGGRLVYSTCTLEPEENQAQIGWFLANHPQFTLVDYRQFLPVKLVDYVAEPEENWATILPDAAGGDGFFLSRLERHE
jgi:16S rRNA (cytosine967-C5)-methyltransferase